MTPSTAAALACQSDPERWFTPASRSDALELCLQCPRRSWCAAEALSSRASYGMWAGIWIDNNLADVAPYLHTIADLADQTFAPREPAPTALTLVAALPENPAAALKAGPPLDVATTDESRRKTVMTIIMARSSGHCEVMTRQCRYTLDTLGSRIPERSGWDVADASAAYAACRPCLEVMKTTDPRLARRLGFVVDAPRRPGFVPLYWRQARWVYLDGSPTIQNAHPTDPTCQHSELAAAIEALARTS
ncbi:WhiB family transcriptional regulator [Mycobacterium riyadhense]|uniref:WhiB family transcriptional regulator n=1 Tax=Mycobacterium riyadhense TaxID=486698 RepID=UPI001958F5E0|nr:WhiB family transcriptional regulator [Mycobacterium riyadhense]